ncbi:MAG TPA: GrpB family protein [Actinomycetota bacterium]|nr:GrpB family protein [Actinomycetota bacterium]
MDANKDEAPREDELRAATVGELKVHGGPITIVPYDDRWPELFAREAERIRGALGERALMIEHVGSTAVPGLSAKPIVDVLVVVADPAREEAYVPDLQAAGYILRIREPDWYEHRLFKGPDADVNLHVLPKGSAEIDRMLSFRDRLRSNEEDRSLYEQKKRELAASEWRYVQYYADAKGDVVEEILARARR